MSVTKNISALFLLVLVYTWNANSFAAVHCVDLNSSNPQAPYSTWDTAAITIQDAVDSSLDGDQVLVTNGVYETGGRIVFGSHSNRVVVDRAITVQSVNGPAATIIKGFQVPGTTNGDGAIRCVYLTNNATLIGFTLINGATRGATAGSGERVGGAAYCRASATISNCIIIGNGAYTAGGGVFLGQLLNCTLINNTAPEGGGAYNNSKLTNCVLFGNVASGEGGAVLACSLSSCVLSNNVGGYGGAIAESVAVNCTLTGNFATIAGGGAAYGSLTNCLVAANSSSQGGGTYNATLDRCIVTGNSATSMAGGILGDTARNCALTRNTGPLGASYNANLYNCTVTGNSAGAFGGTLVNSLLYYNDSYDVSNPSSIRYCCTPIQWVGAGMIAAEPQLASAIHLSAASPCRGAANPTNAAGKDIDGESWNNPPSIGCDEFNAGVSSGALSVSITTAHTNFGPGFTETLVGSIEGWAASSRWEFGDGTVLSNRPYASHAWATPGNYQVVLRAYPRVCDSG